MTVYHAKTAPDLLTCFRQALGSACPRRDLRGYS